MQIKLIYCRVAKKKKTLGEFYFLSPFGYGLVATLSINKLPYQQISIINIQTKFCQLHGKLVSRLLIPLIRCKPDTVKTCNHKITLKMHQIFFYAPKNASKFACTKWPLKYFYLQFEAFSLILPIWIVVNKHKK